MSDPNDRSTSVDEGSPIPEASVRVWVARLDDVLAADAVATADAVDRDPVLSDAERVQAHQAAAVRRREFVGGRRLMRMVLGAQLGCAPREVPIAIGPSGKPMLATRSSHGMPSLEFSLAHTGDQLLVAVSRAGAVGVDVERIDAHRDHEAIARRFFAREEREALAAVPEAHRAEAFTRCWTRKEAIVKAIGTGIAGGLSVFAVPVEPAPLVRLWRAPASWHDDEARGVGTPDRTDRTWVVRDIAVPAGYLASLALRGAATPVSVVRLGP